MPKLVLGNSERKNGVIMDHDTSLVQFLAVTQNSCTVLDRTLNLPEPQLIPWRRCITVVVFRYCQRMFWPWFLTLLHLVRVWPYIKLYIKAAALNNKVFEEILANLKQFVKEEEKILNRENRKEPLLRTELHPQICTISVRNPLAQTWCWKHIRLTLPFVHPVDVPAV